MNINIRAFPKILKPSRHHARAQRVYIIINLRERTARAGGAAQHHHRGARAAAAAIEWSARLKIFGDETLQTSS